MVTVTMSMNHRHQVEKLAWYHALYHNIDQHDALLLVAEDCDALPHFKCVSHYCLPVLVALTAQSST